VVISDAMIPYIVEREVYGTEGFDVAAGPGVIEFKFFYFMCCVAIRSVNFLVAERTCAELGSSRSTSFAGSTHHW